MVLIWRSSWVAHIRNPFVFFIEVIFFDLRIVFICVFKTVKTVMAVTPIWLPVFVLRIVVFCVFETVRAVTPMLIDWSPLR